MFQLVLSSRRDNGTIVYQFKKKAIG